MDKVITTRGASRFQLQLGPGLQRQGVEDENEYTDKA